MFSRLKKWWIARKQPRIITRLCPEDARWWHRTLTTLLKGQFVLPVNVSTDKGLPCSAADRGLPWTDQEGHVEEIKLGLDNGHISVHLQGGYYCGADIEIIPENKTVFIRSIVGKNVCVWMLQVLTDIFPDSNGFSRGGYTDKGQYHGWLWSRFGTDEELVAWRTAIDEQWQHRRVWTPEVEAD